MCSFGWRKSPSISRTRRPISAIAMLRLLATVVLPSAGPGLVTTMTCGPSEFCPGSKIEVSMARNDSATADGLCFQVTSSRQSFGSAGASAFAFFTAGVSQTPAIGITPSSGKLRNACRSPGA